MRNIVPVRSVLASVLLSVFVVFASVSKTAHAAIPLQINYQGRVAVSGQPFDGNGLFRFTLANADTSLTIWCNDGSVPAGQPAGNVPTSPVSLPVINGIFNVRLGDTIFPNMTALPSTVFDSDRVVLRTWFDDGTHGNALLSPDQPITSVAYAFHAAKADTATTANLAQSANTAATANFAQNADTATTASFAQNAGIATTATMALDADKLLKWVRVTETSQQAEANRGYLADNASTLVTITFPISASLAIGDVIRVSGLGSGGWKIAQNAGQKTLLGNLEIPDYGSSWTARQGNRSWYCVASSADGTKLVACVRDGQIYTSSDSGVTWTPRESSRPWSSVASSADGAKLVACALGGYIYTSPDSGVSWTPVADPRNWWSVASSADGAKIVACVNGGQIYTSPDSGANWTARESSRAWYGVASSADGTKLVACVSMGYIYTSSDSGVTWDMRPLFRNWYGLASSADGTRLVGCVYGGQMYTSSDSGVTWTARESNRNWQSVACSADGTKLVACVRDGQIYTSSDSGVTWTARESDRAWYGIASSADGTIFAACAYGGQIHTYGSYGSVISETMTGTGGSLSGGRSDAVELQYIGDNTFIVLSYVGSLSAQ